MENLLLSCNVVAPLLVYILTGVILKKTGILNPDSCRRISSIVFYAATPALCLTSIMKSDFTGVFENPFILYLVAGILVLFSLTMLLVPRFCHDKRRCGPIVQGIFRSNDGIFGLAVALPLLGESNMALMVLSIAVTIPLFNALGVIDMELFRGGKPNPWTILKRVVTNPIIIGCVLGFALSLTKIPLPAFLDTSLNKIAGMCAPLGFLALGGTLTFASFRKNRAALTAVSLIRLVVSPVVFVGALYLLGFRDAYLIVALILFGAPSAMTTYAMACAMNGDEELAGGIVSLTSVLSILTIFLFIFLLKQLGVA